MLSKFEMDGRGERREEIWHIIFYYFPGSCQGAKQTGNASGSLSCLDKDYEGSPANDESAGDFLSQCCQGTLQFHQKCARRRA